MNHATTTPSILRNQHAYGNVETVKYHDAFPRPKDDPMAVGFKFGYWGERHFNPSHADLPPSRTVLPSHTDAKRVRSPSPTLWSPKGATGTGAATGSAGATRAASPRASSPRSSSPSPRGAAGRSGDGDGDLAAQRGRQQGRLGRSPSPATGDRGSDGQDTGKLISADARLVDAVLKLQRKNKELEAALEVEREAGRAAVRELRAEARERKLLEEVLSL